MSDWQSALTVAGLCFGVIGALGAYLQSREAKYQRERADRLLLERDSLLHKLTMADHEADRFRTMAANRMKSLAAAVGYADELKTAICSLEARLHRHRNSRGRFVRNPTKFDVRRTTDGEV